jgi:uncharacterized membrane protein YfcA
MTIFGLTPQTMASTALVLNILVASISFSNYYRAGHLNPVLLWPFLLTSIPAAFLGGYLKLSDQIYYTLLYAVLTFVALRLLFFSNRRNNQSQTHVPPIWAALLTGLGIGLLSGMVGIGGGIFLSPVIILAGWGSPKQSSAVAAAFIVLNSLSGLTGRFLGGNFVFDVFGFALIPFGLLGALGGSWMGAQRWSSLSLRRTLGVVMSLAVSNYWWKLLV